MQPACRARVYWLVMKYGLFAALVVLATPGMGQAPDFGGKAQAAAMSKLSFMLGRWEGGGWIEYGGRRIEFKGTEEVEPGAGGTVFAVRGVHKATMQGREFVIHDAYAVIQFDDKKSAYKMTAHLSNGLQNEYALQVKDKGYQWELKGSPMGDVRYTMTLTPAGEWREIGEAKQADGVYKQIFEMVLKKSPAAK